MARPSQPPARRVPRGAPAREHTPRLLWLLVALLLLAGVAYGSLGGGPGRSAAAPPPVRPAASPPAPEPVPPRPVEPAALPPPVGEAPPPASPPARQSQLRLIARQPTNRTFNYRDAAIAVEFSLPVNRAAVQAAFRVTPPMEGRFAWPSPTTMVFTPRGLWEQGGSYLVTLGAGITDASGAEPLEPTSWEFATVGGYFYSRDIQPLVATHCAGCHAAAGPAARIRLDSYAALLRFVAPGHAERSPLLGALSDSHHQGTLPPEAGRKLYILRDWIVLCNAID